MDSDRHARLVDLFERVCTLPPSDRSAWLESACDDPTLRAEVLELLAHDDADGFLTTDHVPGSRFATEPMELALPAEIGEFVLHEEIGRGGMGVVLRATQRHPAREVALKVLLQGGLSTDSRRRFELEAEALGRLQHPGIAQIHAAGTYRSAAGELPYLAMELVRGVPLGAWIERAAPDRRTRLEFLAEVCDAVHHAHQRGLIHRDLKPANILVDDSSRPKVLDFGIARLIDDERVASLHTRTGQVLGTLAYMSPEQAVGEAGSVDVRTDVHALGVVGFEMLTDGQLPYPVAGETVTRALHVLSTAEPRSLASFDPSLRGDLDTIFGKALQRDPEWRYGTAAELAADLRRHLADEPIAARRPTAVYQLRKFTRRHRGLVAGLLLAALSLVAGTVVSVVWALRAEDAAERARIAGDAARTNAAAARAEAEVSDFVVRFTQRLFLSAAPEIANGREITARELLARGCEEVLKLPEDASQVRGQLLRFLGTVEVNMGEYEIAEPLLVESLQDLEADLDGDDPRLVEAHFSMGFLLQRTGRPGLAEEHLRTSLDMHRHLGGGPGEETARALQCLGLIAKSRGQAEEALRLFDESYAAWLAEDPPTDEHLGFAARTLMDMANVHSAAGRLDEAEGYALRAMEAAERSGERRNFGVLKTNLGHLRLNQGRLDGAEVLFREALALGEELLGPDNPILLPRLVNLGTVCGMTGRLDESDSYLKRALDLLEGRDISHDEVAARALSCYGTLQAQGGRIAEALGYWRRAVEIQEALGGPLSRALVKDLTNMAQAERYLGHVEEAQRIQERLGAIQAR